MIAINVCIGILIYNNTVVFNIYDEFDDSSISNSCAPINFDIVGTDDFQKINEVLNDKIHNFKVFVALPIKNGYPSIVIIRDTDTKISDADKNFISQMVIQWINEIHRKNARCKNK